MKITFCLLLLLAVLIPANIVYAYGEPTQGTDNATDIIIWYGDNVTIESANLTGEMEITGLTDTMEDISNDWLSFVIVAFLLWLFLKYGGAILYALGVPVAFTYGFVTAGSVTVFSPLWVAGVAIGIIGLYFLYNICMEAVNLARGENGK